MSSSGSSKPFRQLLFPNGFAGEVMRHIAECWSNFKLAKSVRKEEPITALLITKLIQRYEELGLPWFIIPEVPITNEGTGEQEGRTDINFYHRNIPGQSHFFTVECKRLRVAYKSHTSSLNTEYFDNGLTRFANEQYSKDQPCAGMLGYVLDNNVPRAFNAIIKQLATKPTELNLHPRKKLLHPSRVTPTEQHSCDTHHIRPTSGDIEIHHLLVGVTT